MDDFFWSRNDAVRRARTARRCGGCDGLFLPEAFAADRYRSDGRQSWCRLCKWEWERGPHGVWRRLRAWLEKHEPESLGPPHGWTEELYHKRWDQCGGECEACGADLGEWQVSGHRLDRIDNNTPHIPRNCQMLCWVCNRRKSNRSDHVYRMEIQPWLDRYGRGRIPWQTIEKWAKRIERPNIEGLRVPHPQTELPL